MNSMTDLKTQTNDALMARRAAALPRGVAQAHGVFAVRAENAEIWDVEGRRWIDFCAGIAVVNTGHCHPHVMAAARALVRGAVDDPALLARDQAHGQRLAVRRGFLLAWLLIAAAWLPSVLARFPGALTGDGGRVLQQYYREIIITSDHPIAYTFLMGLGMDAGRLSITSIDFIGRKPRL